MILRRRGITMRREKVNREKEKKKNGKVRENGHSLIIYSSLVFDSTASPLPADEISPEQKLTKRPAFAASTINICSPFEGCNTPESNANDIFPPSSSSSSSSFLSRLNKGLPREMTRNRKKRAFVINESPFYRVVLAD